MGWYIALALGALFVAYIAFMYRKMKNIKDVAPSKEIQQLTNNNFKSVVGKGLVLVDFWAPWCAPCKMIAPTLNEIAEEYTSQVTIAKVNVDDNDILSNRFNIRSIPTMILFRNGKELKRISGVKPKKAILKEMGID